ncbi:MAG: RluA family pseudouridine synthase [Clostridia bacterium]|nr:RluA family pseudouridine synthase [Clostridia bacterium]
MDLIIDKAYDNLSVKDYLYNALGFSSALVKRLKYLDNGILLNGKHVTVRQVLNVGDKLTLAYDDTEHEISDSITPCELPLSIIYEDEHIIALDKPAGMPTHPSHNHHSDTLANALAYYFKLQSRPFVFRAVNRLDADTSGIVLVAKSKHASHLLTSVLQADGFKKEYIALLHGRLEDDGEIDLPIMRAHDSTMIRIVDTAQTPLSKRALTRYRIIKAEDERTLVHASPITGRTHQLRVHFSHIGHPIFGDGLYGTTSDGSDFPRLALHCKGLSFKHPFTGEELTLYAPVPNNFYI